MFMYLHSGVGQRTGDEPCFLFFRIFELPFSGIMDSLRLCLLILSCFILVTTVVSSDCVEKEFYGCDQIDKQCVCSTKMACHNPFDYRSDKRCQRALFGDTCRKNDCENKGQCVQTKNNVYLCKCEGTGFYGHRCEKKCPKDLSTVPDEDRLDAQACVF